MRSSLPWQVSAGLACALVWSGCRAPHTTPEPGETQLTSTGLSARPDPDRWPAPQHLVLVFEVTDERGTLILHSGRGLFETADDEVPDEADAFAYAVDWNNDGVFDQTGLEGPVKHLYGEPGTYTVRLAGKIPRLVLCVREVSPSSREKLDDPWMSGFAQQVIDVVQWGRISWRSMRGMFAGCSRLTRWSAVDRPSLSNVTDTSSMFAGASSFDQPIERWDMSGVTTTRDMFLWASSFNQPLQEWDVSRVTDMSGMFEGASSFDQPLARWDVSSVVDMSEMFSYASSFDQPLELWDVSGVTDMSGLFDEASSFNHALMHWDVSGVKDMSFMFSHASSFDQPLARWDVSSVQDMDHMFSYASSFDQPLDTWDVSRVTNTSMMFHHASRFDQSLARWDISRVTDMRRMFEGASAWSPKHRKETIDAWRALVPDVGVLDTLE